MLRLKTLRNYPHAVKIPQPLKFKTIIVAACSIVLAACSKDPSGLYVNDRGGPEKTELDIRSDGSAALHSEWRFEITNSALGQDFAQILTRKTEEYISESGSIPKGQWTIKNNEIHIVGKSPSGEKSITAIFRIEPNGDLIGILPEIATLKGQRLIKQ